jgi:hypothetical protein
MSAFGGVRSTGQCWTDIVHSTVLQFPEPERSIAYDLDPPQAIATRKKVIHMVATDRLMIAGMQSDFPVSAMW